MRFSTIFIDCDHVYFCLEVKHDPVHFSALYFFKSGSVKAMKIDRNAYGKACG